jgi:hypothetical protein
MRRALAPLGALLLGAALVAAPTTPSVAETPTLLSSSAKPAKKIVVRKYGAGPVRQDDADQRLVIRFRGKKGDRVMVTRAGPGDAVLPLHDISALTGPRGKVRREGRPWWKLRHDGWYSFQVSPYGGTRIAAQLTRLRFVDIERDAAARTLPVRQGYVWAAGFQVPKRGLLSGTVLGKGGQVLVRPDKAQPFFESRYTLVLGDGMPATTGSPYGYPRSRAQHAGAVMRLLTAGGIASAVTPARVVGTLDGAPVPVDAASAHAVEVTVDGTDGQWFRASSPMVDGGAHVTVLQGPDGHYVDPTPLRNLWQLTATGQSRLLVFPNQGTESTPVTLSSLAVGPTLVPDAPAVKITADAAGRGTMLRVESTQFYKVIATSNVTLSGDWRAYLLVAHVPAYDRGCNGCGEGDLVGASAANPVSQQGNGTWVYLPATNGSGTIDLQARSTG